MQVQSESKGPRTRNTDDQGQEKMNVPAQTKTADMPLLYLSVLFRPSVGWMMPTHIGEVDLLHSDY